MVPRVGLIAPEIWICSCGGLRPTHTQCVYHALRKIRNLEEDFCPPRILSVRLRRMASWPEILFCTPGRRTQDAGRRTQDAGRRTQDAGRRTQDAGRRTQDAGRRTQDAGRQDCQDCQDCQGGLCRRGSLPVAQECSNFAHKFSPFFGLSV